MARRPTAKKRFNQEMEELNLVPIMNLVTCLIPMVLFGASFVQIGVINVNAPKFGTGQTEQVENDDEKPLNLTVAIGDDGFYLSATGADIMSVLGLAPEAADPAAAAPPAQQGPLIPKKGGEYDFVELYNKLVQIKDKFADETIINLTADPTVKYKYIIKAMDVMRVRLEKNSYDDLKAFQAAKPKVAENNQPELLWPDVVLAVAQ